MNCPFCYSSDHIKNGIMKSGQRFLCKSCHRTYTQNDKTTPVTKARRRLGLIMYLQGYGVTSIGKHLGVSHVTVIKWVTKYGKAFDEIRPKSNSSGRDPGNIRPGRDA